MFRFVLVVAMMMAGVAKAHEAPPQCLPPMVNTHQVLVTGEYGGKPFAYTITSESPSLHKPPPGQGQAAAPDNTCPLTS